MNYHPVNKTREVGNRIEWEELEVSNFYQGDAQYKELMQQLIDECYTGVTWDEYRNNQKLEYSICEPNYMNNTRGKPIGLLKKRNMMITKRLGTQATFIIST